MGNPRQVQLLSAKGLAFVGGPWSSAEAASAAVATAEEVEVGVVEGESSSFFVFFVVGEDRPPLANDSAETAALLGAPLLGAAAELQLRLEIDALRTRISAPKIVGRGRKRGARMDRGRAILIKGTAAFFFFSCCV